VGIHYESCKNYISAEKPPYQKGGMGKYVGILFYNNYLRLYSGRISCNNQVDCILYGILKGKELLKQPVDIEILTDIPQVLDYINNSMNYSAPLQKIRKYSGTITWKKIENNDSIGTFLQIILNNHNPNYHL